MKRVICLIIVSAISFLAGSASERYERNAWKNQASYSREQLDSCREATSNLETGTLIPFNNADGTMNLYAAQVEATASPIIWEWMVKCSQSYFDLALNNHFALDCPNGNIYIAPVLQLDGTMKAEGSCKDWPS